MYISYLKHQLFYCVDISPALRHLIVCVQMLKNEKSLKSKATLSVFENFREGAISQYKRKKGKD